MPVLAAVVIAFALGVVTGLALRRRAPAPPPEPAPAPPAERPADSRPFSRPDPVAVLAPPPARPAPRHPSPPPPLPAPEPEPEREPAAGSEPAPEPAREPPPPSQPPATPEDPPPADPEPEPPFALPRRPQAEHWPESDDSWTCEIRWQPGYAKSRFRAVATPPHGGKPQVIAESPVLRWTLMMDAETPTPDLVEAQVALAEALEAAGWKPTHHGEPWYSGRFVWPKEDPPRRLETS